VAFFRVLFCNGRVTWKYHTNVFVKCVKINDYYYIHRVREWLRTVYYCLNRGHKLFMDKNQFEFIRINHSVASISSFRIGILSSSKSIQFDVKITWIELDDKVKLWEILGLLYLFMGQYLSSGKILKVFMICNNVDRKY